MAICLDAYFNLKLFPILAILAILWAHVVNALVSVDNAEVGSVSSCLMLTWYCCCRTGVVEDLHFLNKLIFSFFSLPPPFVVVLVVIVVVLVGNHLECGLCVLVMGRWCHCLVYAYAQIGGDLLELFSSD